MSKQIGLLGNIYIPKLVFMVFPDKWFDHCMFIRDSVLLVEFVNSLLKFDKTRKSLMIKYKSPTLKTQQT